MKINKTNAARLLDKAKIAYELIPYEVDENDLSAVHVAASLGEDINCVFKTLILHGDKSGYFVCVIPGEHEVDLKLAAILCSMEKMLPRSQKFSTVLCLREKQHWAKFRSQAFHLAYGQESQKNCGLRATMSILPD